MRIADTPPLTPDEYPFSHQVRVRFADTDAMGVVHHSRYLPYLEEARVEYLRHIGHPYDELREGGDMPILEQWMQYRQPLRFDEVVTVHLRLADVTRATFQMQYLLTVDDEQRATGVTAHSALTPDGRPTRLPEWLRKLAS